MSATPSPTVQLLGKLKEVADAIPFVEKRGRNDHHHYDFVQAVDVVRDVRAHLLARSVVVIPGTVPGSVRQHTETGGKAFVTTVDLIYRFVDTETAAEVVVPWTGAGSDTGGDKGLYKAYTGGLKYALLSLFLLPTSNDPENDALTAPNAAPAEHQNGTVGKDAERPPAPSIPLDRAKSIADAAVAAGLAAWGTDSAFDATPVLKAKLAELGVTKVGQLNVDQAEDMEAFIAAEAAADRAPEPQS
jgi:hypothetical protein